MQVDLTCVDCGRKFDQKSNRGRMPKRCPECRIRTQDKWREKKRGTASKGPG